MITAAHCAKTLISAASGGLISIQPCIKLLFPGMVTFLTNLAGHLHVGTAAGALSVVEAQAIEEVLKALTTLFIAFPETDRRLLSSFVKGRAELRLHVQALRCSEFCCRSSYYCSTRFNHPPMQSIPWRCLRCSHMRLLPPVLSKK